MVACFFGQWPSYIRLFLKSCQYNPLVDFLIVSDCGPLPQTPDNVTVVPMSFGALKQRIAEKLEMPVALDRPYKLCDFKTAYGVILEEHLEGYDFWGCTDLDLAYGNILNFITDDLLAQSDVIAARPWYLTGFFFLFRNTERLNYLYRQSADYRQVYGSSEHFSFIECNKEWQKIRAGHSIRDIPTAIESMTEVIRREERNGLRVHFADMARETAGSPLVWDRGRLTEGEKEWLLFHFVVHKSQWSFAFPRWDEVPDIYTISRWGLWKGTGTIWPPMRDIRWVELLRSFRRKLVDKTRRSQS